MRLRGSTGLLAILVVALAARVAVVVATPDFKPIFDAADFDRHAASISAGDGYPSPQLGLPGPTAFRPPAYPIALALIHKIGGGWTAERLLGALLGVVTVVLVFLIARRLWGRTVGLTAGAICAVFPPLVLLNVSLLSETLFVPLTLAAVLAVLEYRDGRYLRWAVIAGVLCGLAVLTRTNGLLMVVALALGAWVVRPRWSRSALAGPVAVLAATAVTFAPWVIRNTVEFDRFVALGTGAGYALAGTYNSEARSRGAHPGQPFAPSQLAIYRRDFATRSHFDEAEFTSRLNDRATQYIKDHPGYVLETVLWNVPRVFDVVRSDSFRRVFAAQQVQAVGVGPVDSAAVFLLSLYLVLALALLGLGLVMRRRDLRKAAVLVLGVPVLILVPALAIYGLPRYRAPADPFLVMLAAVGAVAVWNRLRTRTGRTASI
jgi:4-amino-4-deoxy-L-arabinose transferase-like glycosyltransferase